MNRKFCDRCGKEMNINPIVQVQNPLFEIKQIYPLGNMPIDLCEHCSKKLVEWIRRNDDGNDN